MCMTYVFRHLLETYLKIESMSHCYVCIQIQSVPLDFSKMEAPYYVLGSSVSPFYMLAKSL